MIPGDVRLKSRRLIASLIVTLSIFSATQPPTADGRTYTTYDECDGLRQQVARVEQQIKDVDQAIAQAEQKIKELNAERDRLFNELNKAVDEAKQARDRVAAAEKAFQRQLQYLKDNGANWAADNSGASVQKANAALKKAEDDQYNAEAKAREMADQINDNFRVLTVMKSRLDDAEKQRRALADEHARLLKQLEECEKGRTLRDDDGLPPPPVPDSIKKKEKKKTSMGHRILKWGIPAAIVTTGVVIVAAHKRDTEVSPRPKSEEIRR